MRIPKSEDITFTPFSQFMRRNGNPNVTRSMKKPDSIIVWPKEKEQRSLERHD